ncbi:MAG: HEPN domain-containing protein [Pirellulales bacterium]|nr:HEPN domain-containing protein [Pirellulales bacterium]
MKTSLPQQSEHVTEQLAAITGVIQELVGGDLAMVILFGSYARGDWVDDRYVEDDVVYSYQSDFDLLVVTEDRANATVDGEFRLSDAIGRRLRQLGLDTPSSTIIVEDIENLNKDLRRGSYFYTDIKKEGVLLFDSGRHTLAEAGPVDPVEIQKHARDDFEHWYESACGFYTAYEAMLAIPHHNNAAFQLHQATERFFNAVVLTFSRYKPKTHDIERLDRRASNLCADFFTVFPRANEWQKRCFDLLKKAYIDARYKRDYAITKEELDYLAARVQKLQELTRRICEQRIADMA